MLLLALIIKHPVATIAFDALATGFTFLAVALASTFGALSYAALTRRLAASLADRLYRIMARSLDDSRSAPSTSTRITITQAAVFSILEQLQCTEISSKPMPPRRPCPAPSRARILVSNR